MSLKSALGFHLVGNIALYKSNLSLYHHHQQQQHYHHHHHHHHHRRRRCRCVFQPNGNIYPVIAGDVIGSGAHDLSQLIGDRGRPGEQDRAKMFQTLQYIMENLIYHITEIMVRFSGWGPSSTVSQKSRYSSLSCSKRYSTSRKTSSTSQKSWYVSLDGDPHLPYHRNHGTVLCHVPNATSWKTASQKSWYVFLCKCRWWGETEQD